MPQPQVRNGRLSALLASGRTELEAGRAHAAERASRKLLKLAPGDPDALLVLGLAQFACGSVHAARETLRRCVSGRPDHIETQFAYAMACRASGATGDAMQGYRLVLALEPDHASALNNLAGLLIEQGAAEEALAIAERAVRAAPGFGAAHNTLGNALAKNGDRDRAASHFRKAVILDPSLLQAHNNLGLVLVQQGKSDEAIDAFRRATLTTPPYTPAFVHLAGALRAAGQRDRALDALRRADAAMPGNADIQIELGHLLSETLQLDAAEIRYRHALRARPADSATLLALGHVYARRGQPDAALAEYRAALAARPGWTAALFASGLAALAVGDLATGFALYEYREGERAMQGETFDSSAPALTPETLAAAGIGRTVLLFDEQGFGDTFLFARYVPLLAQVGLRVALRVRPPVATLLRGLDGVAEVADRDEALPAHDCQARFPSLGWILQTTPATLPAEIPYLRAQASAAAKWKRRLDGPTPLVAVTWAGNPVPLHRSISLATFAPVFDCPGLRFVSVQKELDDADRDTLAANGVLDVSRDLADFADTAAVLGEADLVVCIDTAVANLAGALGRPVWVALGFQSDWRWGREGAGTPWYPTARLFRQETWGDWAGVVARMRTALLDWSRSDRPRRLVTS